MFGSADRFDGDGNSDGDGDGDSDGYDAFSADWGSSLMTGDCEDAALQVESIQKSSVLLFSHISNVTNAFESS